MKYIILMLLIILVGCSNEFDDIILTIQPDKDTVKLDQPIDIILKIKNESNSTITIHNGNSCLLYAKVEVDDERYCVSDFRICYQALTDLDIKPGKSYEEVISWSGEFLREPNERDTLIDGDYFIRAYATTLDGETLSSDNYIITFE